MYSSMGCIQDEASESVVLVDERDAAIGTAGKLQAHRSGLLHRAFSVTLFNSQGHMLLQQRALSKYHSPGLWSNACCGHPRPDEETSAAARRRVQEELGITCHLREHGAFTYHAQLDATLTEHEYDHVFVGIFDGEPSPNAMEIMDWRWSDPERLVEDVALNSARYTAWLPLVLSVSLQVSL